MSHKTIAVNLRWLSIFLTVTVIPYDTLMSLAQPGLLGLMVLYLLSNLVVWRLPDQSFAAQPAWLGLILFDVAVITVVSFADGGVGTDAFFLYLPVIAWSACYHGVAGVTTAVGSSLMAYLGVLSQVLPAGISARHLVVSPEFALRMGVMPVMGAYFGYMAQRLRVQIQGREAADEERGDLEAVVAATHELSNSLSQGQVLSTMIQQAEELVGAFRCSVVHVDDSGNVGSILISREMLANQESLGSRTLSIGLDNYPELREAIATGSTVVVNDIDRDSSLNKVVGHLRRVGIRSLLVVPLTTADPVVGTLMLCMARRESGFTDREIHRCELIAGVSANVLKNAYMHESLASKSLSLKKLAVSDPLTSLYNRRFFDMRLAEEFRLASRHKVPLAMILFDVDHFKSINDSYGHPVGDRVLVALSRTVLKILRQSDCMARYGGEEFVVLLPLTDMEGAIAKAEEVRGAVSQMSVPMGSGAPLQVHVSCGVSHYDASYCHSPEELVQNADQAVYLAKEAGRDRVCGYQPPVAY